MTHCEQVRNVFINIQFGGVRRDVSSVGGQQQHRLDGFVERNGGSALELRPAPHEHHSIATSTEARPHTRVSASRAQSKLTDVSSPVHGLSIRRKLDTRDG